MATTMEWIRDALRDHPQLAVFLTLAAGYLLGRVRIGSFKLGPVVGCLLAGVAVGQIGIIVPGVLGTTFFLLFLFSTGYKTGPQFFRGFGRGAFPQVALTLIFDMTGFLTVYAVAIALGSDAGAAAGLLAGGLHASEALGTGSDALARLAVGDDVRCALIADATVAYAVTYLIATFVGIFLLVQAGPWLMRVDLRAECKKLEDELGMKKEEVGVVSAYKQFVMRAYRVPEKMTGKSVAEIESEFSPERVFVERVKNAQGLFDAEPNLRLLAGDLIVDEKQLAHYMETTVGIVTALNPVLGYEKATELAQEVYSSGKGVLEIIREQHLLTEAQIKELLDPAKLTNLDPSKYK